MGAFKQINNIPVELLLQVMEYQLPRDQLSILLVFPGLAPLLTSRHTTARDRDDNTLLHLLATAKSETTGDQLINDLIPRKNINPHVLNNKQQTPLMCAAAGGNELVVRHLLERADVDVNATSPSRDFPRTKDYTALAYAVENGHEQIVKWLLAHPRINVDLWDSLDTTLMGSIKSNPGIAKLLVGHANLKPELKDGLVGHTVLATACEYGMHEVVTVLLTRNDVDINSLSDYNDTPLHLASKSRDLDTVKLLLAQDGIFPDARNIGGQTPLSIAIFAAEIVEVLLARGDIETDSADAEGRTPLSYAVEMGLDNSARLLLARHDVNVDSVDMYGRTPLSHAAENDHANTVKLLLNHGAQPDYADEDGITPMAFARMNGFDKIVTLLSSQHETEDFMPVNPPVAGPENP